MVRRLERELRTFISFVRKKALIGVMRWVRVSLHTERRCWPFSARTPAPPCTRLTSCGRLHGPCRDLDFYTFASFAAESHHTQTRYRTGKDLCCSHGFLHFQLSRVDLKPHSLYDQAIPGESPPDKIQIRSRGRTLMCKCDVKSLPIMNGITR